MSSCRMANSSYDWLFAKPALRWLFNDYMEGQARALVRIRSARSQPGSHRLLICTPRVSWHALQHSATWRSRILAEARATACCACSPVEDPRISITARFAGSLEVQDRLDHIRLGKRSGGVLCASGAEAS